MPPTLALIVISLFNGSIDLTYSLTQCVMIVGKSECRVAQSKKKGNGSNERDRRPVCSYLDHKALKANGVIPAWESVGKNRGFTQTIAQPACNC